MPYKPTKEQLDQQDLKTQLLKCCNCGYYKYNKEYQRKIWYCTYNNEWMAYVGMQLFKWK